MLVKLVGLGMQGYFQDSYNTFDCLIVVVGFVEIAVENKGLTALRTFRLARLFKVCTPSLVASQSLAGHRDACARESKLGVCSTPTRALPAHACR